MYKRRDLKRLGKDIVGRRVRLTQLLQITANVEAQERGLGYIQIDIRTQVEAIEFRTGIITECLVGSHDTFLVVVRPRQGIAQTLRTARHI